MSLLTVLILGIGLAMDAFAVSISKGLAMRTITWKEMLKAGLWFGIFQGLMPALGYFFGDLFTGRLESLSGWIGFAILAVLGGAMIREAMRDEKGQGEPEQQMEENSRSMSASTMLLLAVATSIDALAIGVTFSMIPAAIVPGWSPAANTMLACGIITVETGILSAAGIKIGEVFGAKFKNKAQIAGGVLLIVIGLRLLAGH